MNKICVVFVCNLKYFDKFIYSCNLLLTKGQYKGDICLVIGNDLNNNKILKNDIIKNNNIFIKYFPDIVFPEEFLNINNNVNTDGRNITKKFQWHKLYLFNIFFKKWNYLFYIDCGMTIFSNILPMLNEVQTNTLLAHSDAYPTYEWQLHTQFDKNTNIFRNLNTTYNLNINYFQTGMMLYDTNIIEENTFDNLIKLALEYPISRTNEQGILALYFTNIKPLWKQIKINNEDTYFYDCLSRNENNKYIMLKIY